MSLRLYLDDCAHSSESRRRLSAAGHDVETPGAGLVSKALHEVLFQVLNVDDLKEDPFAPHLAYHPLGGKLKDVQAVSITHDYRIILTIHVTDREIILLDIGSHDEVYR